MKILSIDPGYGRCGVAVLEGDASSNSLIYSACIETSSKDSFADRLGGVGREILNLIQTHQPDTIALEELFFTNNAKTALHVAEVRGMIIYLSSSQQIPLVEFNPSTIKIAITGVGRATKEQVSKMVSKLLRIEISHMIDDEIDAIAIGITALSTSRFTQNRRR